MPRRRSRSPQRRGSGSILQSRSLAVAAGTLLALALAFSLTAPPSTPGPLERDFEAYYCAGATLNAGGDPYSRAIWTAERRIPGVDAGRDELLPFVGPAAALPAWSALARLPYRGALVVWTTFLIAMLAALVGSALVLTGAPRSRVWFALAFTVASAPVLGALALGQAALVSAGGVALALVACRARSASGAVGAMLLAAVQPNLTLALAARIRSRWDVAGAACAAALFASLTLIAGGGVAGFAAYIERLRAHSAAERDIAIQHTPAAIAYALGLSPSAATFVGLGIALLAVVTTIAIVRRERLDALTATLVAGALLPLAVPFFHEQDFALELLPILMLALRARGRARGLGAIAAVCVLIDWFGFAQRHAAAAQILCLGCAVAFAFTGLADAARSDRRSDFAGLATLAVLGAIAVPLALHHPAPTWPDMLPPHFHAPPTLDASAVWGAEQQAAGLAQRDPVWGFLRAIPLAGCIVLAAALVLDGRDRRRHPPQLTIGNPAGRSIKDLASSAVGTIT